MVGDSEPGLGGLLSENRRVSVCGAAAGEGLFLSDPMRDLLSHYGCLYGLPDRNLRPKQLFAVLRCGGYPSGYGRSVRKDTAGIELDEALSPAEKLKVVQGLMEKGDERAAAIYDTIGAYFGYAIAFYSEFYDIKHVLIMGRVTSGEGGVILLSRAQEVLDTEFPELAKKIKLHIPDEKSRRVGQSVAAASLPKIN